MTKSTFITANTTGTVTVLAGLDDVRSAEIQAAVAGTARDRRSEGNTVTIVKLTAAGDLYYTLDTSTPAVPVAAQGTLTIAVQPTDGDTVTIGGRTYTFETTLTDVDGNIQIGAAVTDTQNNLVAAFDLSGTAGTDYATSMTANTEVTIGAFATNDAVITAVEKGAAGNSIATTETFTSGSNVFDAATLGTTTAGAGSTSQHVLPAELGERTHKLVQQPTDNQITVSAVTSSGSIDVAVVVD